MKKLFLTMMVIVLGFSSAWAVPAQGNRLKVKQPDGTVLTIRLVGDEYLHYNVTDDGYSVVRTDRGYCYANLNAEKQLVATDLVAHEASQRTAQETAYLQTVGRYLAPAMKPQVEQTKARVVQDRRKALAEKRAPQYDYSKFRGLVILVEYNDQAFDREDYKDVISNAIVTDGYKGYTDYAGRWVACTGSVRDYFNENSMGVFKPDFDIVGPIKVNRSKYYAEASEKAAQLTYDVINAADSEVDFSQYDGDGDGVVDMVFFIFAGHGSHVGGNDERLLWPHASQIYNPNATSYYNWQVRKDGVVLGRYACSVELMGSDGSTAGYQESRTLDGIGTICHEFSHVLGLPDFYDVDYEGSGGESNHPGEWDVMAGGSYNNNSHTPAGYTLFERYAVGFATPEVIDGEGSYSLEALNTSNKGFRLNSPNSREYFLLENRQRTRWDAALPYHGMLVFRVDSTNTSVWQQNAVNNNPKHNYFELVRAGGSRSYATAYDPFPGYTQTTTLDNSTSPANLKTWDGKGIHWGLKNIRENGGVVTFDVNDSYVLTSIDMDPAEATLPVGTTLQLNAMPTPESATYTLTWTSADETIATVSSKGLVKAVVPGTTTITVKSDNGVTAQTTLTVIEMTIADNISAFKALDEGTQADLVLTDAQVLYNHEPEGNLYVRDATGSIILSATGIEAKANDIINGTIFGSYKVVDNMPYFVYNDVISKKSIKSVVAGEEAKPHEVNPEDLGSENYADLVLVKGSTIVRQKVTGAGTSKLVTILRGDDIARLFNYFQITDRNITIPADAELEDNTYDILGIFGTHKVRNVLLDEIYLLAAPTVSETSGIEQFEVEDQKTSGSQAVYDLQGRKVISGNAAGMNGSQLRGLSSPQLPKGIYIVGGRKVVVK